MIAVLAHIKQKLTAAGINYELGEWKKKVVYPYFVGDYSETPSNKEDGLYTATLTLNGFTRGQMLELIQAKEVIERTFAYNSLILGDGSGVDVSYSGCLPIPTGDAELKRIQITLSIKNWRTV